jgi:hypothetical protein
MIDKSKSNVLWNSKLLIHMYGGHIRITWFLGVRCTSRAHTQYKMRASKRLEVTNAVAVCDSVNHRPVGNPKRKV